MPLDVSHLPPALHPYLWGGTAAMVAEASTFPIDTAKIRLQLQGSTGDSRFTRTKYSGFVSCLQRVAGEEGASKLYRGLPPALLRQAVYGSIKYGLYYTSKDWFQVCLGLPEESTLLRLLCGVLAGSVSSAIACPTDVMKIRMQARTTDDNLSTLRVGLDIYQKEGVRGLWRGVGPTSQRSGLLAGVQLPAYDIAKEKIKSLGLGEGPALHLIASLVAGLTAALASNPVDVVRTRMMVQRRLQGGEEGVKMYKSTVHCAYHTVRGEGPAALYKGFLPSFARMGPWNVIFFLVYEQLKLWNSAGSS